VGREIFLSGKDEDFPGTPESGGKPPGVILILASIDLVQFPWLKLRESGRGPHPRAA